MPSIPFCKSFFSLLLALALISQATCQKYSTWMLESIISRGEGISATDGLLGQIQKGLFQEALRAAIQSTKNTTQAERWSDYLGRSVQTGIDDLLNATADAKAPLDRLCIGRSLLQQSVNTQTDHAALSTLRESVDLQLRNANGGLWYFSSPPPPYEPYPNLSFSDGMYAYAPFAALYNDIHLNPSSALLQLQLIHTHCHRSESGLLVHGYDASRRAPWADKVTGASPVVWGRSLAWYTVGLVDALEIVNAAAAASSSSNSHPDTDTDTDTNTKIVPTHSITDVLHRIRTLFHHLALAELTSLRRSARKTGRSAVWQVVDEPGQVDNFVEASATALLTYALAKGMRLGFIPDDDDDDDDDDEGVTHPRPQRRNNGSERSAMTQMVRAMYEDLVAHFVVRRDDGMLDFEGTSVIASLSVPRPDYYYYTHRNVTTNSLIGTSAFVLASLEIERLGR